MARIATLTFHTAVNYGAALQMYALSEFLTLEGHEVEVLDYEPPALRAVHNTTLRDCTTPKKLAKHLITALPHNRRRRTFRDFTDRNVRLSPRMGTVDMARLAQRYDAVVVGSDQVWNADITASDTSYMLPADGAAGPARISYAASIGTSRIPEEIAPEVGTSLSTFDGLSVREKSAAELLENQFGLTADVALDPVFLLDRKRWQSLAEPPANTDPFVFLYLVSPNGLAEADARQNARARAISTIAIHKQYWRRIPDSRNVTAASPESFLGYIDRSTHMVTNSFHGMALATILGKNVDLILNANAARNTRMTDLASLLHNDPSIDVERDDTRIRIRHRRATARVLDAERKRSADFLLSSLEKPRG